MKRLLLSLLVSLPFWAKAQVPTYPNFSQANPMVESVQRVGGGPALLGGDSIVVTVKNVSSALPDSSSMIPAGSVEVIMIFPSAYGVSATAMPAPLGWSIADIQYGPSGLLKVINDSPIEGWAESQIIIPITSFVLASTPQSVTAEIKPILVNGVPLVGNMGTGDDMASANLMVNAPLSTSDISFSAQASSCNTVSFNWDLKSDELKAIEIQYSADGATFSSIVNAPKFYTYRMSWQQDNVSGWYRLKAVNLQNEAAYSGTQKVSACANATVNLYPNPVQGLLNISGLTGKVDVVVTNGLGKLLLVKKVEASINTSLDVSSFSPGNYFVLITNNDGSQHQYKFTKM